MGNRSNSISGRHPARLPLLALACAAWLAGAAPARAQQPGAAGFDAQFQSARELAFSGQREEALAAYTALLERSPGNADVLLARGRLHAWMKNWAEAESDLRAALARSPAYADAWSALGDVYLWSDRPQEAAEAYGRWLALAAEDDAEPLVARGRAWRAAGDAEAARRDFEAARSRGAEAASIDAFLDSLAPRALGAGALSPVAVARAGETWSASLGAGWTGFSASRDDWSDSTATIRRHFEQGSVALEVLAIDRFGIGDHALALDAYVDLWPRAYAHLRYQHGPERELFPATGGWAELFQGLGRGWEISAGAAYLDFTTTNVAIYSLGIGKYIGNWYLRLRHVYVPGDDDTSNSDRLQLRYYYRGDADNYFEMSGGYGRSDQPLPLQPGQSSSDTWSAGLAFVSFPGPRWGYRLGAAMGREDGGFDERSVTGTLYFRW